MCKADTVHSKKEIKKMNSETNHPEWGTFLVGAVPRDFQLKAAVPVTFSYSSASRLFVIKMMAQISIVRHCIHQGGKRRVAVKILVQSFENILIVLTRKTEMRQRLLFTRQPIDEGSANP